MFGSIKSTEKWGWLSGFHAKPSKKRRHQEPRTISSRYIATFNKQTFLSNYKRSFSLVSVIIAWNNSPWRPEWESSRNWSLRWWMYLDSCRRWFEERWGGRQQPLWFPCIHGPFQAPFPFHSLLPTRLVRVIDRVFDMLPMVQRKTTKKKHLRPRQEPHQNDRNQKARKSRSKKSHKKILKNLQQHLMSSQGRKGLTLPKLITPMILLLMNTLTMMTFWRRPSRSTHAARWSRTQLDDQGSISSGSWSCTEHARSFV